VHWLPLHNSSQILKLISDSNQAEVLGVLIFKHSTRCSISDMALSRLERKWNFTEQELPVYFLDLLANRSLSDEVASTFRVEHESPQILLIQKGLCTFSQTHNGISFPDLVDFIRET
jgi:bacillithiol system protein YtxJ